MILRPKGKTYCTDQAFKLRVRYFLFSTWILFLAIPAVVNWGYYSFSLRRFPRGSHLHSVSIGSSVWQNILLQQLLLQRHLIPRVNSSPPVRKYSQKKIEAFSLYNPRRCYISSRKLCIRGFLMGIVNFKKIMIATDGSVCSGLAIDKGIEFARLSGGAVYAVYVVPTAYLFSIDKNYGFVAKNVSSSN
jgi:Universal stress protein family